MTGSRWYPADTAAALAPMAAAERELAAGGMIGLAALVRLAAASLAHAAAAAAPAGTVAAGKASAHLATLPASSRLDGPESVRPAPALVVREGGAALRGLQRLEAATIGADLPPVRPLTSAELREIAGGDASPSR